MVASSPTGRKCFDPGKARVPWHGQQTSLRLQVEQVDFWGIHVPTQVSPLLIQHSGKAYVTCELRDLKKWVSFTLVGKKERRGNGSDHDGKFLEAVQTQVGHRDAQESFSPSGIWYGEQHRVTD